jgi:predicted nucleotidyltransferase
MFKIEDYKQAIEEICKDLRVKHLDLVGSASRSDFQPDKSDIDLLVEFDGIDKLFDRYFELKIRLEEQLARQVDVIQESAVKNPYIKKSLDRDKVRIYGS